ncbi:MAG: YbjQ family protein [Clostridiaceae bacterium]|nr:YbjQ family protein [Clostridiaceae bacterium]
MILTTCETVPGAKIVCIKGIVQGSTIQCKNIGRDIGSSFRQLVGGEMESYTKMMNEARDIATQRMIKQAENLGADAIVAFRYSSSTVMGGAAEMLAYGTAVTLANE